MKSAKIQVEVQTETANGDAFVIVLESVRYISGIRRQSYRFLRTAVLHKSRQKEKKTRAELSNWKYERAIPMTSISSMVFEIRLFRTSTVRGSSEASKSTKIEWNSTSRRTYIWYIRLEVPVLLQFPKKCHGLSLSHMIVHLYKVARKVACCRKLGSLRSEQHNDRAIDITTTVYLFAGFARESLQKIGRVRGFVSFRKLISA